MLKETEKVSLGKMQWLIFMLGFFKIPMIGYIRPRLILLNDDSVELKIKLRRRSKNHLNSMYFGALMVGADVTAGVHAFYFTRNEKKKVSFAFKAVKAEFLRRAESDVVFKMSQGNLIKDAVNKSMVEAERVNLAVEVSAFDRSNEKIAIFEMMVSIKVK